MVSYSLADGRKALATRSLDRVVKECPSQLHDYSSCFFIYSSCFFKALLATVFVFFACRTLFAVSTDSILPQSELTEHIHFSAPPFLCLCSLLLPTMTSNKTVTTSNSTSLLLSFKPKALPSSTVLRASSLAATASLNRRERILQILDSALSLVRTTKTCLVIHLKINVQAHVYLFHHHRLQDSKLEPPPHHPRILSSTKMKRGCYTTPPSPLPPTTPPTLYSPFTTVISLLWFTSTHPKLIS